MKKEFFDLVEAAAEKNAAAVERLEYYADAFPTYVLRVYNNVILSKTARFRLEGQDLRDRLMELDSKRRAAHEAAIDACNILNRQCDRLGVARCSEEDTGNRSKVADFTGRFVFETYFEGINADIKGMDDLVKYLVDNPGKAKDLENRKK